MRVLIVNVMLHGHLSYIKNISFEHLIMNLIYVSMYIYCMYKCIHVCSKVLLAVYMKNCVLRKSVVTVVNCAVSSIIVTSRLEKITRDPV